MRRCAGCSRAWARMASGAESSSLRRLFFALVPAPEQRAALARAISALRPGARPVAAANLHMTLAFLGSVDAQRERLAEAAAEQVHGAPFELDLQRVGHWARPRVLWCAATPAPAALFALHGALAGGLRAAGFELDRRPFSPHVTVARNAAHYHGPGRLPVPVRWQVDVFQLVESTTAPAGAVYRVCRVFRLQPAA